MIEKKKFKKINYYFFPYFFISVLLLTIGISSCKSKEKFSKLDKNIGYNLLFITIDTLRADSLGCYGHESAKTPNIDYLAERGVRFENCYASVPLTLPSHVTIFTGREPITHNVRNNGRYFLNQEETTLAELMKSQGYITSAIISSFVLHSKFGLNQGFDYYEDSLDIQKMAGSSHTEITADVVYKKFTRWFETNHHHKFFSWVHFYDPHSPYNPPEEFKKGFENNPYDGEISFVDHFIGKIVEDLKTRKILDKTIIVLASDHGESFGEHNESGHGVFCYDVSLRIPLIFYNPSVFKEARVVSHRSRLVEIMPTILELFQIEVPAPINGCSFTQLLFKDVKKNAPMAYFESLFGKEEMNWAPLTGILYQNYKYISLPEPELYDLNIDPDEKTNLFKKKNRLARELDQKLKKYMLANSESKQTSKRDLTKSDIKKLESLGYISKDSQKSKEIIDPKKGIKVSNILNKASNSIRNKDYDEAEKILKTLSSDSIARKNPRVYDVYLGLYQKKGEPDRVLSILKEAIKLFPEVERFQTNLAIWYLRLGKYDESLNISEKVLQVNPKNSATLILLGKIYKKKGKIEDAISFYKKAQKIEPSNILLQIELGELLLDNGNAAESKRIIEAIFENNTMIDTAGDASVKSKLGLLLLKLNEYDRVITMCLQLLSRGQKSPEILNQLGKAYLKKGEFQEAEKAFQKALEMDKEDALSLSNLGTLNLTLFRVKKEKNFHIQAKEFYSRALKIDPRMITALNGLAVAHSFAGDQEKAISYWRKSLQVDPSFTDIYFNLGITYIKLGKKKQALKYLKQCKKKFYSRLSLREQRQLDNLISEISNGN